jgi:hypothetical protein
MSGKRIGLGVLAAVMFASALPAAGSAQTGWRTFGASSSYGRGGLGVPSVNVISTTRHKPSEVRLVFTDGDRTRRTEASWNILCWTESTFDVTWRRGGHGKRMLPLTVTWDPPAWVDFCEIRGFASNHDNGVLKVTAQARYP